MSVSAEFSRYCRRYWTLFSLEQHANGTNRYARYDFLLMFYRVPQFWGIPYYVWQKAASRAHWHLIVDTATLRKSMLRRWRGEKRERDTRTFHELSIKFSIPMLAMFYHVKECLLYHVKTVNKINVALLTIVK